MLRLLLVCTAIASLVVGAILPLVSIAGPFGQRIELSIAGVVQDALAGDGGEESTPSPERPRLPGLDELRQQLESDVRSLDLPIAGPALLIGSLLALLAHYLLTVPACLWTVARSGAWRLHLLAALCGVLFGILFLAGAHLTQEAINSLRADSLGGKLLALVSRATSSLYEIRMGAGGWVLAAVALAGAVAGPLALRRPPTPAKDAQH
jgi:hypothetical protein